MHIDVLRTLLFDFEHPDEPVRVATAIAPSTCVLDWLWTSAEAVYHGHGLTNVRTTLLLSYLNRSSYSYTNKAPDQELYSQQKSFLEKSLVSYYASGRSGLLRYLFKCNRSHSYHSSEVGSWFIHHLSQLGLNVTECLERENKTIRRGLLRKDNIRYRNDRKVTFQRAHGQAWSISWEWSYDPLAPGYHLVSEFNALAADSDYTLAKDLCWPFSERRATYCFDYSCDCCKPSSMRQDCMEPYERHWERAAIRFQVRMAARARKYQKLARKHLPRPEMPGSWKW